MRIKNDELVLSGTDMTAGITSNAIYLGHIINFAVQAVYTGSPDGTISLEASNDKGADDTRTPNPTITNWTSITSQAVSAAGSIMFNVQDCGYRWVRLRWVDSASGSPSTMTNARINVKGI